MHRLVKIGVAVFGCIVPNIPVHAADDDVTDVNIITALDNSESMNADDIAVAIEGMADAIRSPAFLQAIKNGPHQRIGFAMFIWHQGIYPEVVSWTVIATAEETTRISRQIEARLAVNVDAEAMKQPKFDYIGRLTDISGAIHHADDLLRSAPYPAARRIINVVGNGADNLGEGPEEARDNVIAQGATINGVVLGHDHSVFDYYRGRVVGGPGAFLMFADNRNTITRLLASKFTYDITMSAPSCRDNPPVGSAKPGARTGCASPTVISALGARQDDSLKMAYHLPTD